MYNYRYINKLAQFGHVNYTLILEDIDDPNVIIRIEKCFKKALSEIDDDFLYQEARKEMIRVSREEAQAEIQAMLAAEQDASSLITNYITQYGNDSFISIVLNLGS